MGKAELVHKDLFQSGAYFAYLFASKADKVLYFDLVFRYDILICSCLAIRLKKQCSGGEPKLAREHIDFQNVCGPLLLAGGFLAGPQSILPELSMTPVCRSLSGRSPVYLSISICWVTTLGSPL